MILLRGYAREKRDLAHECQLSRTTISHVCKRSIRTRTRADETGTSFSRRGPGRG